MQRDFIFFFQCIISEFSKKDFKYENKECMKEQIQIALYKCNNCMFPFVYEYFINGTYRENEAFCSLYRASKSLYN